MLDEIIYHINSYEGYNCNHVQEIEENFCISFTYNNNCFYMLIEFPYDPSNRDVNILISEMEQRSYPHVLRLGDIWEMHRDLRFICLVQKEFLYYWNHAIKKVGKDMLIAEIYLPDNKKACEVECIKIRRPNSFIQRIIIKEQSIMINSIYAETGLMEKGLLVPIIDSTDIIPPTDKNLWECKIILDIVANQQKDRISLTDYKYLKKLSVNGLQKIIVFTMMIPTGIEIAFVALLKFKDNKKKPFFEKIRDDLLEIIPIYSERRDIDYMVKRIGGDNCFLAKKVLVIGAGSVGSYLIAELAKLGIMNMSIADIDNLETGNKAKAMKSQLEKMYPQANISVYENLLDKKDTSDINFFNNFDLIIIAVGSSDTQRKYNLIFKQLGLHCAVVYNWLDAEGKGCHVLYSDYKYKGCFNCLFQKKGDVIGQNKSSFADGSEVTIGEGCGGSFTPYGNEVLLKNTYITMELVRKALIGELNQNVLISCRNNFESLNTALNLDVIISSDFYEESCEVCGKT